MTTHHIRVDSVFFCIDFEQTVPSYLAHCVCVGTRCSKLW